MTVSPHLCRIRTVIGVSINGFKEMEILSKGVINIIKHESWKHVTDSDGRPYRSFSELVERPAPDGMHTTLSGLRGYLANYPKAQAAIDSTLKVWELGTNQHTEGVILSHPTRNRGTSREYLVGLLNSKHPTIAAKVHAGEVSARKGAIEAGIIKLPDSLELAKKHFSKLTKKQRASFDKWRATQ